MTRPIFYRPPMDVSLPPIGLINSGAVESEAMAGPKKNEANTTPSDPYQTPVCAEFHRTIELIGKRWTGAILAVLMQGPHRFNEILNSVSGLSDRLLTERLRELEDKAQSGSNMRSPRRGSISINSSRSSLPGD